MLLREEMCCVLGAGSSPHGKIVELASELDPDLQGLVGEVEQRASHSSESYKAKLPSNSPAPAALSLP